MAVLANLSRKASIMQMCMCCARCSTQCRLSYLLGSFGGLLVRLLQSDYMHVFTE